MRCQKQWQQYLELKFEADSWDKELEHLSLGLDVFAIRPELDFGRPSFMYSRMNAIRARISGLWAELYGLSAKADVVRGEIAQMKANCMALRAKANALWSDAVTEAYDNVAMHFHPNGNCELANGDMYVFPETLEQIPEPPSKGGRGGWIDREGRFDLG